MNERRVFPAVLTLPFSDCVCLGNKLHLLICKTILPVISVTQVLIPGVFSLQELESPSSAVRALSGWDRGCLGSGAKRPPWAGSSESFWGQRSCPPAWETTGRPSAPERFCLNPCYKRDALQAPTAVSDPRTER